MASSRLAAACKGALPDLLVALGYLVAAGLGQQLAIPPGFASPVWPAAGVALGALLVRGGRAWVGVWLGELAFDLCWHPEAGAAYAALTAGGCALQAVIGASLGRRLLAGPVPLAKERAIAWFLLLVGPVAAVTSASVGVGQLVLGGLVPVAGAAEQWIGWWAGDALGVLLFTPVVLTAWPGAALYERRGRSVWLPLALTAAGLAVARLGLDHAEEASAKAAAKASMERVYRAGFPEVGDLTSDLLSVERLFASSAAVEPREFHEFTQRLVSQPGVVGVAWVPRVLGTDRRAFEQVLAAAWPGAEGIKRIGPDGSLGPSPEQAFYFPVLYDEPASDAWSLPGVDLASEPARREAMSRAVREGGATAGAPVALVESGKLGVPIFIPVVRAAGPAAGPGAVEANPALRGFVAGFFDLDAGLSRFRNAAAARGFAFRVADVTDGEPGLTLAGSLAPGQTPLFAQTVPFAGRTWRVEMDPATPVWTSGHSPAAQVLCGVSVMGAFLVALAVLAAAGRTASVQAEVEARTAELNRELAAREAAEAALRAGQAALRQANAELEQNVQDRTSDLAASEQFSVALFEFAPDAMVLSDRAGVIARVNRQAELLFGWPRADLEGASMDKLIPPADRAARAERRNAGWAAAWASQAPTAVLSARFLRKDGSTFSGDLLLTGLLTTRGPLLAAAVRDVTERERAEAALRQGLQTYHDTIDGMLEGARVLDFDYRYVYVNDAATWAGGPTKAQLIGKTMSEAYPGVEFPWFPRLRRCMEERVADRWIERVSPPDGVERWMELRAQPVHQGLFLVTRDVTAETQAATRAEEHRRALEAERASLAARVGEATAELVATNKELEQAKRDADAANLAKSAFLAAMSHEIRTPMNGVLGMVEVLINAGLPPHQADAAQTIRESAFSLLRIIDDILDFSKIEAGRMELEREPVALADLLEGVCASLAPAAEAAGVWLFPFCDPRLPASIWGDAVRLRQVLTNLAGNAVKFSGGRAQRGLVAVRATPGHGDTPTLRLEVVDNGIGMSEEVQQRLFAPFVQAEASTTRRYGGTGLGLVISRRLAELMGGQITLESAPGRGARFVVTLPLEAESHEPAQPLPSLAGVDCVVVEGPTIATGDVVAYLMAAGATVHVAADSAEAASIVAALPQPVVVHASDHPPHPGGQAAHAWVFRGGGAAGVRHAVHVDGNALRRRALVRGAAVAARLLPPDTAPATTTTPPRRLRGTTVADARARGTLILVADDDAVNRKVILSQLRELGCAAEIATNGAEALRLWQRGSYGLVITDLHMPELDGYELAARIRAAGGLAIPILALTADASRGEEVRALQAGMQAHLTKPLSLDGLRAAIRLWLPAALDAGEPSAVVEPARRAPGGLDVRHVRTLVGDDPAVIREVIVELEASLGVLVTRGRAAVAAGRCPDVGAIAHQLKATCGTIGAVPERDACVALENAAALADAALVRERWAPLDAALPRLVDELAAWLLADEGTAASPGV